MDPIKQSLIEAAGDLTQSERNVRYNVRNAVKRKNRFKLPLFIPIAVTVCLVVIIGFFVVKALPTQYSISSSTAFDESYFDILVKMYPADEPDAEQNAFKEYVGDLAILAYGEYRGISLSEEEVMANVKEYIEAEKLNEMKILRLDGVDNAIFKQLYIPHFFRKFAIQNDLYELYHQDYPTMFETTLSEMIQMDANSYFKENGLEEILSNPKFAKIPLQLDPDYEIYQGIVAAEREDAYLVVLHVNSAQIEGLTIEDLQIKFDHLYWMPKVVDFLQVGSMIEVSYSINHGTPDEINQIVPSHLAINDNQNENGISTHILEYLTVGADGAGLDGYYLTEKVLVTDSTEEAITAVLNASFNDVNVERVTIQNGTEALIHFGITTLQGSHLTSSTQTAYFWDQLHYAMAKNFPEITHYSLLANGQPAMIGDSGPLEEPIQNTDAGLIPSYVPIFPK